MAPLSEKHKRYRTKKQMAADIASALNSNLTYAGKHAVCAEIFWMWTEFDGKTKGCRYWSSGALEENYSNPLPDGKKFRHEHSVPKIILHDLVFDLSDNNPEIIYNFLDKVCIGVVVTIAEDRELGKHHKQTMPEEFFDENSKDYMNPWLRYRMSGLRVFDMQNNGSLVEMNSFM